MLNPLFIKVAIEILRSLLRDIELGLFKISEPQIDALTSLSIIFNRFDQVAKQLRKRQVENHR